MKPGPETNKKLNDELKCIVVQQSMKQREGGKCVSFVVVVVEFFFLSFLSFCHSFFKDSIVDVILYDVFLLGCVVAI